VPWRTAGRERIPRGGGARALACWRRRLAIANFSPFDSNHDHEQE